MAEHSAASIEHHTSRHNTWPRHWRLSHRNVNPIVRFVDLTVDPVCGTIGLKFSIIDYRWRET